MATRTIEPTTALVGYQVREADGRTVVGEVEGVRPSRIRIHKIPGLRLAEIIDAPDPPPGDPEGWRMSGDWWADLLGHDGLFDAEGRGAEPFLHPDQK